MLYQTYILTELTIFVFILTGMTETEEQSLIKIGWRLKELRLIKEYDNIEHFAFDFELGRSQYLKLENGKANFRIKTLLKALSIHDISFDDFMAMKPKNPDKN